MIKYDFQELLLEAAHNGTLMTQKHDPDRLGVASWTDYRSVLSHELADDLEGFISRGLYNTYYYHNSLHPSSPDYWVIESVDSGFNTVASGVPGFSNWPDRMLDRLVVVSGLSQGLHMFGESSVIIQAMMLSGNLTLMNTYLDP
jgi:hypothetical protein